MKKEIINIDTVYVAFLIISLLIIIGRKNLLDISYFLLMTSYYIRIKLHYRRIK